MNVASQELCEELYSLSGGVKSTWKDTEYRRYYDDGLFVTNEKLNGLWLPAYDLGYLLRKLPKYIGHASQSCRLGLFPQGFTNTGGSDWCASYDTFKGEIYLLQTADTAEDVTCKLAIELFKQGILTKQEGES